MSRTRLNFDNAATTFPKPPAVLAAMVEYLTHSGASPGRGAYAESADINRSLLSCREAICALIGASTPEQIIFTANCSDSLNLALKGLVHEQHGGHVICTDLDHNSVIRPLNALHDRGVADVTYLPVDGKRGCVYPEHVRRAIRSDTRLITMTQVSNVTGAIQPFREVARIAREAGIVFLLDAAQGVGHLPIAVEADSIDLLAAPGHKALLGPPGTGFLYIRPGLESQLRPLKEGGTGSAGEEDRQPEFMPDRFEVGSRNAVGILGMFEGVKWVLAQGLQALRAHDQRLSTLFINGVRDCEAITIHGPLNVEQRIGLFSVTVEGWDPHDLSAILEARYGILTRSGLHCAPRAHRSLNTAEQGGTTRFSFGPFLLEDDVNFAVNALLEIASVT